jgi:sec-independent protein translocase protein TatB
MFNIGTGELILIAVLALLVLGPKGLPELARGIGKFMREFRRQTDEVRGVVEREFYRMDQEIHTEVPKIQAPPEAVPLSPQGPEGPPEGAAQPDPAAAAAPATVPAPIEPSAGSSSVPDPSPQPSPPSGERGPLR